MNAELENNENVIYFELYPKGPKGEDAKINGKNSIEIEAGNNITIDNTENGIRINSTGGGSGGTSNYNDLSNKPKINNVELSGNKSLNDLGIQPKGNYLISETDPTVPSYVKNITQNNITSWNNKSDFSGNYNDLSNKPTIPSEVTEETVANWGFTKNTGNYSKPSTGIPEEDLSEDVQDKLNSGGGGGTTVQANPTLDGTESHLDGLKVGNTKYSTEPDLSGKVISIMGDSISTYAGWIPVADGHNLNHLVYYPTTGTYMTDVSLTWWHQLIFKEFKAKLGINDSWSGSFVGNNQDNNDMSHGPDTCMASITRITNLGANGTPDIIYFYGGTNDIGYPGNVGESLGTFNNATDYSTVDLTTKKWTYFVDAYRTAIMRMQYYYPKAKIIVLLPAFANTYYNRSKLEQWTEQMKEICDYFGVNYIDLRACGITWSNRSLTLGDGNVHPSIYGMKLIAQYVKRKTYEILENDNVENVVYTVTNNLITLTNGDRYIKGVSSGNSYSATLTGSDLTKGRISMDGTDITSTAYDNETGVITIASVTGNIVVSEDSAIITPVTGVSLNASTKSIMSNDEETLTATIIPANATNKNVTWSVNNNHVTINPNGLSCTVTGASNGTSIVTVTTEDGEYTATCTFTVHEIALERIAITTPPSTTAYHYGDTFSKTGMVVTAYYDDETGEVLDDTDYTVSPSGSLTDSDTSVTISYTYNGVTKTATQAITVATLSSIAVTTQPNKTTYGIGETFNSEGMTITATWSDNTTSTATGYTYSPNGALSASDDTITISYTVGGVTRTTTQSISVLSLSSISITTAPTKTEYVVGETFDTTGMIVTATWNDNTTSIITDYTYSPNTALTTTDTTITVSYTVSGVTQTDTQTITVVSEIWYDTITQTASQIPSNNSITAAADFAYYDSAVAAKYAGKKLNIVRLVPAQAGIITFRVYNGTPSAMVGTSTYSRDSQTATITITQEDVTRGGYQEFALSNTLNIGANQFWSIQAPSDTGLFKYAPSAPTGYSAIQKLGNGSKVTHGLNTFLGVDMGYGASIA